MSVVVGTAVSDVVAVGVTVSVGVGVGVAELVSVEVGVGVAELVSVGLPEVVGVDVRVCSTSLSCSRVRVVVPEVLVLVFDVSGCSDSGCSDSEASDVFDSEVFVSDVFVSDVLEPFAALEPLALEVRVSGVFDASEVFDFPLTTDFVSLFFPSAIPGSATTVGTIAAIAAAATARPARFHIISNFPLFAKRLKCRLFQLTNQRG